MKRALLSLGIASAALISGCDHYSDKLAALDSELGGSPGYAQDANTLNSVATAAGGAAASVPYDRALAQAYYARAVQENEVMDYRAAQYFTGKAYEALHGKAPAPGTPKDFGMDAADTAAHKELADARAQLIAALQMEKTPENQQALIDAQVNYDGWLDQVSEDKSGSALTCRDSFMNALSRIEDPFAEGARFNISFVPGQTALSPEGQKAIADVAALVRDNPSKRYKVVLTQASAGNDARFQSIYNALTLQGVQGEGIFKKTVGIAPDTATMQPVAYSPASEQPIELVVKFAPAQTGATATQLSPAINQ